jgi:hypothetical protein
LGLFPNLRLGFSDFIRLLILSSFLPYDPLLLLAGWLVGWLAGWLDGWLLVACYWLAGCLLPGWLAAGCFLLAGWQMAGWLVG